MGYMQDGLTFNTLRRGNRARRPYFPGSLEWAPAQWLQAIVGELGEYANLRKKVERGDFGMDTRLSQIQEVKCNDTSTVRDELAKELADVVIYLDRLADTLGIDLGNAVMQKWNETARKVKAPLYLDAEDYHIHGEEKLKTLPLEETFKR